MPQPISPLKFNTMQRPILSLFALFISLGLSIVSCARFQDRPLIPSKSIRHIEARSLANENLNQFIESVLGRESGRSNLKWNLDRFSLAAIYYHPDLVLARAQADSADAAIKTAAQRLNPTLTITPTWIRNLATAAAPWIAASTINIPIETAGKRGFRIEKTGHLIDAARLRVVDAAWLVRGRLRLAFLEAYAATEAERLLNQQLDIQKVIVHRLEQQQAVGEISPLEVTRSHLALNQFKLTESAALKRTAESRVLLATAIGIPVEGLKGIDFDFTGLSSIPNLKSIPIAKLKEQALLTRPDLLAALADYSAAQSALQLEIANQYPNIQVNPAYAWEMGEHRWSLGLATLQLPILHQNQGPIAEAEAKRREFAMRFEALQMRILGDIDKAHAGVAAVIAKWDAAEKQIRSQQENLNIIQALTKVGESDSLALFGAQFEKAVAERAHLDVLVETQQVLNLLEDSLRIPLASSLSNALIVDSANRKIPK